jgi:quercetin dioxygenase-like cupin family protein
MYHLSRERKGQAMKTVAIGGTGLIGSRLVKLPGRQAGRRTTIISPRILLASFLAVGTVLAQEAQVTPLISKDLPEFPGKEGLITVVYPPGASSPIHRHNADAFVYVLEGSVVMQVKGGKEVTLTPGQTFYEGPSDIHVVSRNGCELSAELRNALLISNHRGCERMRICGGLFRLEIDGYEMSTRVSFRDGMQLAVGWFDADEEHIPFDVFTSCSRASTRERLVHQFEVSDFVDLRQSQLGSALLLAPAT